MAAGTAVAGIALGIFLVIEGHITPIGRVVAVRALIRPMAVWPCMARIAERKTGMAEGDRRPIFSCMAVGTLAGIVATWS
jgi:hypothetical protein